jgi:anti-anti-sigma factor
MNVSSRRYGSAVVLQLSGRLDQDTCDAFRGDLMKQVEVASKDGGGIVLDLSKLEYVSSAGLRCFMLASRQAKQVHMKIYVAALQPMVAEIFEISHFNLIFQVFPKVREALGAISADSASAYEKG